MLACTHFYRNKIVISHLNLCPTNDKETATQGKKQKQKTKNVMSRRYGGSFSRLRLVQLAIRTTRAEKAQQDKEKCVYKKDNDFYFRHVYFDPQI